MIRPTSPTRPPRDSEAELQPGSAADAWAGAEHVRRHRASRRAPKPVFVDRSGRRHRIVVASGAAAGVLVLLALIMLVAGLFGASPVPLPGLPDMGRPVPTQPANEQPAPTATAGDPTGGASEPSATTEPTSPRHVPTQTPSKDRGRPTP